MSNKKFVVKMERNPFDKSFDTIVPVLYEDGKPYGVMDERVKGLQDGDVLESSDLKAEWVGKKTKHAVPGDTMTWGRGPITHEGTVVEIIDNEKEYFDDIFVLTNVISTSPTQAFNGEFKKEQDIRMLRRDLNVKQWLQVTMKCKCCNRWL